MNILKRKIIITISVSLILIAILLMYLIKQYPYLFGVSTKASGINGSLAFLSDQTQYTLGQTKSIKVSILISTDNQDIYGTDLSFTFNNSILKLADIEPYGGSQTLNKFLPQQSNGLFDKNSVISKANQTGLVSFSVIADNNGYPDIFRGNTILTTLVFTPINEGKVTFAWNMIPNQTDDSNIVLANSPIPVDILQTAKNLTLTINPEVQPTNIPTIAPTIIPTLTPTISTQITPTTTSTISPPSSQQKTLIFNIRDKNDDAYEDGKLYSDQSIIWIGRGSAKLSYSAFRFTKVNIPKNAQISDAYLEMTSPRSQWIPIDVTFAFENSTKSLSFSESSLPSKRLLTVNRITLNNNVRWSKNGVYRSPNLSKGLNELLIKPDWSENNDISIIVIGSGKQWSRKAVVSYEGNISNAVKLVVVYK